MTMTMMINIYWQKKKNATGNQFGAGTGTQVSLAPGRITRSYDDDDDGLRVAVLLDGLGRSGRSIGGTARGATKSQLCHSSGEQ